MDKSVATRIAKRFITLPLDKRTLYLEKMLAEGVSPANLPIPEVRSEFELIPLSFAQERQWFLWQLDPTSAAYHIPTALRLRGALDVPALEHAFNALVARHESLRTTFQQVDERAVQVIAPHLTLAVELLSLDAHLSDNEQQQQIKEFVEHETQQPFDLHNGPLLRVKLLRLADDDHVLVLTQHHIVSDGASMQIMVSELVQVYGAFVQGQDTTLAPLQIQYADYAIWQRHWMEAGERERQLAYWNKQLGGEQPVLELPTDYPRPAVQSFRGAKYSFELSAALGAALKKLAQQYNVTPFMILLASFQALLHRYSRQTDIRVGVPSANRNRVETEGLIGFFVNTQVLKADISPLSPFSDLLAQVKQTSLDAQTYQELPFEQLVEALHPERSLSHSPLFQVMFNHQNANVADHDERSRQLSGLTMEGLSWENPTAQFDLTLTTVENPQGFCGSFTYATDLFDPATIERMSRHWQCLLTAVVANPLQSVAQLPMLDAAQQQLILEEWNCSTVDYPRELRIHQLIENQAERLPNAIAIVFAEQRLTYQQLNSHANRLAGKLIELGVGPDVLVGIAVERSVEMIVGLLAVLKAGGAYVPLDPSYPEDRLAYMMQDSGVALLLTQSFVLPRMPVPHGVQTLILDQTKNWLEDYADVNPRQPLFPEHLAYAIYTSGSTGKPKGVMVPHGALSNFVASMTQAPGVSSQDRVLSLTTFSFDIFGLEIYVPLSIGARVVLTGQAINQDPDALLKLVHNEEVTVLQATPSTWRMLLDSPDSQALRGCKLLCGGEALPEELAQRMLALSDKVWNLYGPTETTIWSALHALDQAHAQPYLGRPIANTVLFLLDDDLGTVPIGVGAELLIGGEGLARGYFQRPALTAERFVPNPFGAPGERLYRTGDLTRYRDDGIIEYISRLDHQVKIRGFRIELGEIEARLLEHHDVREAAVLAQEGPGGTQLVAYLVPNSLSVESELRQTLKLHLKHGLADYMVPPHWVFLPTLPLTPNGKLDRKALPSPDADQLRKNYIAPQNEVERTVANIWAEVLKLDQVGMTDDFFELGGHSLLATRVVSRVRRALKCDVSLKSLFEHSELQAFVTALEASSSDHSQLIPQERGSSLPLSYAQERQWFLWQLDPDSAAYHIPAALRLKGELDIPALERSFSSLIERHESLRTTFILEGEHAVQVIAQATPLSIKLDTLVSINEPEQAIRKYVETQIQELFDLQSGPLLRVKLLQLATDDHVLIIVQHHIVSDAWSMQVMVRELIELYAGQSLGLNVTLPALPVQYADYAIWQRQWMNAGERERQLAYWSQQLGGEQTLLELPLDHPRPMEQSFRGAKVEFALSDTLSLSLKQLAKQLNVTPFMLLLASFQTLLHRYSRQSEICVGVPIANRNRLETEGLIGFFVNTQVLKAIIDGQLPFSEFVQQVKRTALQAQAHQDLPFEHLVEALRPERALSHSPLFQVLFNHQNSGQLSKEHLTKLSVESLPWETQTAQFDLTLNTFESVDGFSAALTYATDLFEPATIERMVNHWQTLLHAIVKSPQKRIGELMLHTASDLQLTLEEWNPGVTQYPATGCLHQLIEAHAAHAPHAIALTLGTHQLSYEQLNTRANQLAHQLIEQGVGPDVMVGLASERSLEMVVGLLAILKAGGSSRWRPITGSMLPSLARRFKSIPKRSKIGVCDWMLPAAVAG
jgi:amino acid adenylation domain-containing protein